MTDSHLRRGDVVRLFPAEADEQRWEVKSVGSEKMAVRRIDDGRAGAWDSWRHEWVVDQLAVGDMIREGAAEGAPRARL
jgi:hypothetical protein